MNCMQDSTTQTIQETMTEYVQKTISELRVNNQYKKIVTLLKLMTNFVRF